MQKQKNIWNYAIVSILITVCITGFGRMSYGIVMPFMRESLSLTYQQAGMLATATAIGYLVMVLLVGIMAGKWGSKRFVIIGLVLIAVGLISLVFVQNYLLTLISMVLLGVGTAFGYTPLVNILVSWFPDNRGLMIGFLLSGMGLGTFITSLLIPLYNIWFAGDGWRYLWLTYGVITIIVTLISLITLDDVPVTLNSKKHVKGHSIISEVYLHRGIMVVALIYGLVGMAYLIPQSFLFSFILESDIKEYMAGLIMGIGGLMTLFSGPLWGAISDRIGRRRSLAIALVFSAISVLTPVLFQTVVGFIISQVIWGLTVTGLLSLSQTISMEQTDKVYAPVALAYVTVYFAGGQMLGPGIGGFLIDYFGSVSAALWLCFGMLLIGFLLTFQLVTLEKRNRLLYKSRVE